MFDLDERYDRDRLALDVAMQFLQREARTRTIRTWTGLTDDRIRKLYRAYFSHDPTRAPRHRGRQPCQTAFFLRTHRLQQETSVLASWFCLAGVMPRHVSYENYYTFPCAMRGLRLCYAYDAYHLSVPSAQITFEHAVFLATALVRNDLRLVGCSECSGLIVIDRYVLHEVRCGHCTGRLLQALK